MPEDTPDNLNQNNPVEPATPVATTSSDANSQQPYNTATPATVSGSNYEPTSNNTPIPKNNKKLVLLAAVVAGLLVLVGGTAAAYYGAILPNKPENILKRAISNTAQETKTKFEGKLNYESTDEKATVKAVNVTFKGEADTQANKVGLTFDITASGAKLPVELRSVDKSLFIKIGDLGSVKGLAQTIAPEYGLIVDEVNKKVANQWIEIDETLLKQAKADCALNTSFALTQSDMELLQKRYQQVPFASIKSNTPDNVNGRSAIKYEISVDDNKGAEFIKGLQELSVVKKIKECNQGKQVTDPTKSLADNDTTPVTLWVDKANTQIVKVASQSTKQDEEKEKMKASFEITMQYGQAQVVKPEGAKPFLEVFGEFSQLFGAGLGQNLGSAPQSGTGPSANASDVPGITPECLRAIQDYSNSGGTKPIPANCL